MRVLHHYVCCYKYTARGYEINNNRMGEQRRKEGGEAVSRVIIIFVAPLDGRRAFGLLQACGTNRSSSALLSRGGPVPATIKSFALISNTKHVCDKKYLSEGHYKGMPYFKVHDTISSNIQSFLHSTIAYIWT